MTATGDRSRGFCLANERPSFRKGVAALLLTQRQCGDQCDGAQSADEHQDDQDELAGGGEVGGDARGQADGGEGGDRLEEHVAEW